MNCRLSLTDASATLFNDTSPVYSKQGGSKLVDIGYERNKCCYESNFLGDVHAYFRAVSMR
jgi:hypothetical protein